MNEKDLNAICTRLTTTLDKLERRMTILEVKLEEVCVEVCELKNQLKDILPAKVTVETGNMKPEDFGMFIDVYESFMKDSVKIGDKHDST